nr:hypothetical protein [Allomuricauda sp.]
MKVNRRILALVAAICFTVLGYFELTSEDKNLVLVILSFVVASLFLYTFFGRKAITSCSLSEINNNSKVMVLGPKKNEVTKAGAVKIASITFAAVVVSFGLGFGVGKLIYHIVH